MSKIIKGFVMALFILFSWLLLPGRAFAAKTPPFPSCLNPQGTLQVSYPDGQHGIPGDFSIHTGSDRVYRLSDDTLTQCFCSTNGKGIQTNWWRASGLSEEDISVFKSQGWIYVPTGAVWGLSNDPYLSKNSNYNCGPATGGTSTSSSSSSDSGSSGSGGSSSTPSILGFAFTGNIVLIYSILLSGIVLLAGGVFLIKRK
jgi:hypothetical protein